MQRNKGKDGGKIISKEKEERWPFYIEDKPVFLLFAKTKILLLKTAKVGRFP